MFIAPLTTHIAASQTAAQVASGDNIQVYGIIVEGTSAGQVRILNNDSTLKFLMSTVANGTEHLSNGFQADKGLRITTVAGVTCTVFHSHPGR